jgi:predicted PurR-regulated permease PerM
MLPELKTHGATAGKVLINWWRAVSIEAFCCAVLWLIGLLLIRVPLAPLWALIAGLMTFIPNFGAIIGLLGPVFAIMVSGHDMERLLYLLGLYAVIVVIDQLFLQPLLMKRVTRVPIWASLLVPLVLGIVVPFWGVLLAPPLLAVVYAFRRPPRSVPPGAGNPV